MPSGFWPRRSSSTAATRSRAANVTRSQSDSTQLPLSNQQHDIHIDRNTAETLWRGERMDYGLAVEVLLAKSLKAKSLEASNSSAGVP
jgi:hypothetical protein